MQLSFKWPVRQSHADQDFIVSDANAQASAFLAAWPDGLSHAALVSGPEASGKTHLAMGWAARIPAIVIDRNALGTIPSATLWKNARHALLEDIHAVSDETALFHLLRHGEAHGLCLLMTARLPAAQLGFTLPDLRSRLMALPQAAIGAPDEALLKAYLFKCFSDRQLPVGDEALLFLTRRMERSFAAAYALVERLEEELRRRPGEITIPLIKRVLK